MEKPGENLSRNLRDRWTIAESRRDSCMIPKQTRVHRPSDKRTVNLGQGTYHSGRLPVFDASGCSPQLVFNLARCVAAAGAEAHVLLLKFRGRISKKNLSRITSSCLASDTCRRHSAVSLPHVRRRNCFNRKKMDCGLTRVGILRNLSRCHWMSQLKMSTGDNVL